MKKPIDIVRKFVRKQQFNPGWAGAFVNPFFIARRGLWRGVGQEAHALTGRLLDVGCGIKPYQALFNVSEYVGLEITSAETQKAEPADYYYDGSMFPFDDASFDSVLCNQVLEHSFEPDRLINEIRRVLKPGGTLLLTVPFVWDEHEQPRDYARYSSFGLAALLTSHNLQIIVHRKLGDDFSIIAQLLNSYLYKVLPVRFNVRRIGCVLLMGPISLTGVGLAQLLPTNPDLYLDQLVVAKKT